MARPEKGSSTRITAADLRAREAQQWRKDANELLLSDQPMSDWFYRELNDRGVIRVERLG